MMAENENSWPEVTVNSTNCQLGSVEPLETRKGVKPIEKSMLTLCLKHELVLEVTIKMYKL